MEYLKKGVAQTWIWLWRQPGIGTDPDMAPPKYQNVEMSQMLVTGWARSSVQALVRGKAAPANTWVCCFEDRYEVKERKGAQKPECRDARPGKYGWPTRGDPLPLHWWISCEPCPENQLLHWVTFPENALSFSSLSSSSSSSWSSSSSIFHSSVICCFSNFSTCGLLHQHYNARSEAYKFKEWNLGVPALHPAAKQLSLSQLMAPAGLQRGQGCRAGSFSHLLPTIWGAALQHQHCWTCQQTLPELQMLIPFFP